MYVIKDQKGFALLNTLIFVMFLGIMGATLVTLVVADLRSQTININASRAFYAAQSGIEYAIRGIMEASGKYSSLGVLHNYSEEIATGPGTKAKITIKLIGLDSLQISSVGFSEQYSMTVTKRLKYSDVSRYAVYATGSVRYVRTIPNGRIKTFAEDMPLFDHDLLKNMAKPTQYFPGNLILNHPFTFKKSITYVEKNLVFGKFNWFNFGNFVVGRSTLIKKSWWPFGMTFGNIYLYGENSRFISEWQYLPRILSGGMFVNGDVLGTTKPHHFYRFIVFHNRDRIKKLMKYSVNGGPLVVHNSTWEVGN